MTEQKNCEDYCKKNNIEFVTETLPKSLPKTETAARLQRQKFFKKYYKKYNANALFLAHTKSDNTETLLYRMSKGTGIQGLCGILEHSKLEDCEIYRPLMNFSRENILKYCSDNNLMPNHDSSNDSTDYTRNFIRHKIVPELSSLNKNLDEAFFNLSQIAISEQNIIKEYLDKIKQEILKDNYVVTKKFINLSKDVQKKLILDFLAKNNPDYSSKKVAEIFDFIHSSSNLTSGKTMSLGKDLWLFVSKEKICTTNKIVSNAAFSETKIDKCGEYAIGNRIFRIEKYNSPQKPLFPKESELKAYVNLPETFDYSIRTRKDGDIICPIGLRGTMKLKKLFINKGVEKFTRDDIILLCSDKEVLWAAGVCLSEKIKVKSLPTHVLTIEQGDYEG